MEQRTGVQGSSDGELDGVNDGTVVGAIVGAVVGDGVGAQLLHSTGHIVRIEGEAQAAVVSDAQISGSGTPLHSQVGIKVGAALGARVEQISSNATEIVVGYCMPSAPSPDPESSDGRPVKACRPDSIIIWLVQSTPPKR